MEQEGKKRKGKGRAYPLLVYKNIKRAEKIADKICRCYGANGKAKEDCRSAAFLGLCQAASRFDSSKGIPFSKFCLYRVSGQVRDYLRREWNRPLQVLKDNPFGPAVPYSVYRYKYPARRRTVDEGNTPCSKNHNCGPIAIGDSPYRAYYSPGSKVVDISYDEEPIDVKMAQASITTKRLTRAIRKLNNRDRRLIQILYFDGLSQEEASIELGLTSRTTLSRIHRRALKTLRQFIKAEMRMELLISKAIEC